jgi:protein phosphatase
MLNEYCAVVYGLTNGYMAAWNEQGGIGPAGLSTEDLHVLDLTQAKPRWHRVVVQGPGPGPRYGHVMALVGQRFLVCTSGNDG